MALLKRRISDGRAGKVSATVAVPPAYEPGQGTLVVLAHGAGAGMEHPFMTTMQRQFSATGPAVALFNFPYKERGGKAPDSRKGLEECYRSVAERLRADAKLAPRRLVLGGKSMGGRIASQIVAAGYPADGLIFLGYPLHPAGRPERMRKDHLPEIAAPMLFVQGTRDSLCSLEDLRPILGELSAPATLHVVEGGDHSFKVLKRSGRSEESVFKELVDTCRAWLDSV